MCGIGLVVSDGAPHESIDLAAVRAQLQARGPDSYREHSTTVSDAYEVTLLGSVLHICGHEITPQPIVHEPSGCVLCWNGEVFGGELYVCDGDDDDVAAAIE